LSGGAGNKLGQNVGGRGGGPAKTGGHKNVVCWGGRGVRPRGARGAHPGAAPIFAVQGSGGAECKNGLDI